MPTRRSPLPRAVLVAVVLSLLVVVIDATVRSAADDPDRLLGFVDRERPVLVVSAAAGTDLEALRKDLPGLTAGLARNRVEALVAPLADAAEDVVALNPPAELRTAHAHLVSAMTLRATAVARLAAVVDRLAAGAPLDALAVELSRLGGTLRTADDLESLHASAVAAVVDDAGLVPAPWIDPATWSRDRWLAHLTKVRAAGTLVDVVDVAVLALTPQPAPVVTEGDVAVLATAEPLTVTVTVGSRSSRLLGGVVVRLRLEHPDLAEAVVREQNVDLAAGASGTVVFSAIEPPRTGVATLVVSVDRVEGESDAAAADNQRTLRLRVRAPDEVTTTTTTAPATTTTAPAD